jgi:hypothetical protein
MNGVLMNIITHLPTTTQFGGAPSEKFGKHNIDGISSVYQNYPETLTIWVNYMYFSVMKA